MSPNLDPRTFRDMLADPALAETISAAAGCPLVMVKVADATEARWLEGLDITAVPAVVVVVAPDPACLPAGAASAADVILTEDAGAAAPFVASAGGLPAAVAQLDARLAENPVAGTALALLLRGSAGWMVPAGLVAESAAYSALQEGAEFRRWRAGRPERQPEPGTGRGDAGEVGSRAADHAHAAGPAQRGRLADARRARRGAGRAVADPRSGSFCAVTARTSVLAVTWTSSARGRTRAGASDQADAQPSAVDVQAARPDYRLPAWRVPGRGD